MRSSRRPTPIPASIFAWIPASVLAVTGAVMISHASAPASLRDIEERYFKEFLRRNPVTATYLGADAYSADLASTAGSLRDYSESALAGERRFYEGILSELAALPAGSMGAEEAVDTVVMKAQIAFMLRQSLTRRHHLRCLDTYMAEPFRGIDWQIQGMTDEGEGRHGTEAEWRAVVERARAVPAYLAAARANMARGATSGLAPDARVLIQDGLKTTSANVEYFGTTLPGLAASRTAGRPWSASLLADLKAAGAAASEAQRSFRSFILETFFEPGGAEPVLQQRWRGDRYAMGEAEYDWALANNLRETRGASGLFEMSAGVVERTQRAMMDTARRVDEARRWGLAWGTPESDRASTRKVMSRLGEDHPKDDAEMLDWYRRTAASLVEYGRRQRLFDIPAAYRLDIIETPPVLRQSVDGAVYYPAPPFKKTGVGRFYVSPTGNDLAHLRENNRASMPDLCAHEGFPGHDWHYQFLRTLPPQSGKVRWLTPGSVEDSSSMWEDSMVIEGWALYAEQLVGEARPGAPDGVYAPEEKLYQLQGQLLRDARVRIDTGIHTGRMSFDEAVDYYTATVDFLPGACSRAASDPEARASCETAWRAVFRYSKWPTQAVTYYLGKQAILDLRRQVEEIQGARFDLRAFHERVLSSGTIPLAYVREGILEWARARR